MKKVYTHQNKALVDLAFQYLKSSGIEATLKNEFSSAAMAPPYNIDEEIWILNDEDYTAAMELLAGMDNPQ